jgi:type II secretory pathway component PulM
MLAVVLKTAKTLLSPTTTLVWVAGLCSTMEQRFVTRGLRTAFGRCCARAATGHAAAAPPRTVMNMSTRERNILIRLGLLLVVVVAYPSRHTGIP